MDTQELLKRVRRIELKTRKLSNNIFAGEYHSAFKGRGMSFSEVREYAVGDEVRSIDWNVTARLGKPYVKVFEEERELTVMLVIDLSGSSLFGTQQRSLRELATEIAATLAFSAAQNNDKVGAICVTDKVEKFIPPKKGRKHILYIIRELLYFQASSKHTHLDAALESLARTIKQRCIAFVLSDFIDVSQSARPLRIAARKHELIALRLYDERMQTLPDVGLMKVMDAETGALRYLDTADAAARMAQAEWWQGECARCTALFNKCKVKHVAINTAGDYVPALRKLFTARTPH